MRILLVRHAQTTENAERRFQGHIHGHLSELGVRQTLALGDALQDEKIDYFFGSPLERAKRTLEAVRRFHPHVIPVFDDDLMERGKGVWEGWSFAEAFRKDPSLEQNMTRLDFRPQGGESLLDVRRRIRRFLKTLLLAEADDTVFVAGHGVLNNEWFRLLFKTSGQFKQDNACINEFYLEGRDVFLVRLNDTSHLRSLSSLPLPPLLPEKF